ncbi:triose-phosphate isomerase [Desulfurobacterium sp.]
MRKPLIAGNWKMNKTVSESVEFAREFVGKVSDVNDRDILICPPFTSLYAMREIFKDTGVKLGAQNMYYKDSGAYTGEISPLMLKDVGCDYVILGHSERRHIFGEDDNLINEKVVAAVSHGLIPILCVGELLEDREAGKTFDVVGNQLERGLKGISSKDNFVVAYEPVWAIGTGKTATPELAEEVHSFLREKLASLFGKEKAETVRILYGGSVKPENVNGLMAMKNIDGALVGGASLKVDSFVKIVKFGR